ncbi:hypothetical protein D1BOALGB6SA_8539 [Olavius sp. associated proteobacterium Delta 1]|nr:hypothetical protein D1BOALGB6SA_8539 [Olavius sp. associated proteobacterium Delta 1]
MARWPVFRLTGQPANRLQEVIEMSEELKQNLNELKVKLEHLRSYL